jgi:hypothetical protein
MDKPNRHRSLAVVLLGLCAFTWGLHTYTSHSSVSSPSGDPCVAVERDVERIGADVPTGFQPGSFPLNSSAEWATERLVRVVAGYPQCFPPGTVASAQAWVSHYDG